MNKATLLLQLGRLVSQQIEPGDIPDCDWPELVALAGNHGLGPMLLSVIRESDLDTTEPRWEPLVRAARLTATHTLIGYTSQQQIQIALDTAAVPVIWFKGLDLARTVYPRPELRPMGDIDLLVPYSQRKAALAAIVGLDYQIGHSDLFDGIGEVAHHYHLTGGVASAVQVELHYRLLSLADRLLPPQHMEWFWQQTRPWREGSNTYTFLSPEAHLLYLSAHAVLQHGEADFRLLRYFDLHRLIACTPCLDWSLVLDKAVSLRWTFALERALDSARVFFGTPLPVDLLDKLRQRRPTDEDETLVTARSQTEDQWSRIRSRLSAMSWEAKFRLFWNLAFPSASFMLWRYSIGATWIVPFYYPRRWMDIAAEIGRIAGKLIKTKRQGQASPPHL